MKLAEPVGSTIPTRPEAASTGRYLLPDQIPLTRKNDQKDIGPNAKPEKPFIATLSL